MRQVWRHRGGYFWEPIFSADLEKFFGERTDAATSGLAATWIARYGLRAVPVFPGADQAWPRFGGAFFLNLFFSSQ
ncbi:hypothetical protein GFL95_15840 [Rhizobium leguminosarum bv. viciae]|nr:hypothetical protein [Rhizobium leguminosarum bv. viciae]